jgi:hypothetical protein
MNTKKHPLKRAQSCTSAFVGVTVDLTLAITIIIARPLVHAVADGRMGRTIATIALPLIGIQPRAARWDIGGDQVMTGARIRVIAYPEAVITRVPRYHTHNRWTIVGIGPMRLALFRASAGRVIGARCGVLFSPRVLVEFVRLKRGSGHQLDWRRVVQVRLPPVPERLQLHARHGQFAGQARRRFPFSNAPQQEHQRRGPLAGYLEHSASQGCVVAVAGPAATGRKVTLQAEQPCIFAE